MKMKFLAVALLGSAVAFAPAIVSAHVTGHPHRHGAHKHPHCHKVGHGKRCHSHAHGVRHHR
jgi:hypothetical protein